MNAPRILFVIDTSGSMNGYIGLVKRHLTKIARTLQDSNLPHTMGVTSFGSTSNRIVWNTSELYNTGGGTNLYGSCIDAIRELTSQFNAQDKILIFVITDGQDSGVNGQRFTPAMVASEVSIAEDVYNWDFLFVGTNQDACKVGDSMGVKVSKSLSFANNNEGFDKMLEASADICKRWLQGHIGHNDTFFSEETREAQSKLGARF